MALGFLLVVLAAIFRFRAFMGPTAWMLLGFLLVLFAAVSLFLVALGHLSE
jgi:hypothetical protein